MGKISDLYFTVGVLVILKEFPEKNKFNQLKLRFIMEHKYYAITRDKPY